MRVKKPTLKKIAGAVWVAVGTMLTVRGLGMLFGERNPDATAAGLATSLGLGLVIGALKGRYVLSRTARRNIRRIGALEAARVWNVFSGRFAIVISLMIGLGIFLRWLAARGWLGGYTGVGGIYVGIGVALLVSSLVYFLKPPPPLPTRTDVEPRESGAPTGVLVVNLGTPDSPRTADVRRYLREFLSDPRVIEVNRALWAFVLNVIILPFRSAASSEAYAKVWSEETGSPLLHYTRRAAELMAQRLGPAWRVVTAMRYGNPSLAAALDELVAAGCRRIVVLPMFPQFSNSTTGSIQARVWKLAAARRDQPAIQVVPPYYDHPDYVEALAARVREARGPTPVDHHVFSFHGLPEAYVKRGDPYVEHCTATAWALARALGLERPQWEMVFQSRFGDEPWLQPYLDEYVPALAGRCPRVLVTCPGFTADCLETIEEVGIRLRADFLAAGGDELVLVPALNDHAGWITAMESLVTDLRTASPLPAGTRNAT